MALTRILGTAVRHPVATTAAVYGVAKGTLIVVQRLVRRENPWSATDDVSDSTAPVDEPAEAPADPTAAPEREPEVVLPDPLDRDLAEPVVIEADDEAEPTPDYTGHVEVEEELVWTSESSGTTASE